MMNQIHSSTEDYSSKKMSLCLQAFSDEFNRRANGNFVSDKIPKAENTQGSVKLLN